MKDSNRFFPSTIIEKKNVDSNTKNSKSFIFFKKHILYLIRPFTNSTFHCYDPKSLKKIITKLRLVLIHLRLYPFFFQDTINSICNCGVVETIVHYIVHCPNFLNER